jgi:hypothetical protein
VTYIGAVGRWIRLEDIRWGRAVLSPPLLPGRGARPPCILGCDDEATLLRWHLRHDGRPTHPYWLLGQTDGPTHLH